MVVASNRRFSVVMFFRRWREERFGGQLQHAEGMGADLS